MKRNYRYDLPEGTVYVVIRPAEVKSVWCGDAPKGRVDQITPYVEVSTKLQYSEDGRTYLSDAPEGYVKVGNHRYRVEDNYRPTTAQEKETWTRPDGPQLWTTSGISSPWDGGIHRESGSRVDYDSPVLKKINPVIMRALAEFTKEVPDWDFRSTALHLEGEVRSAETEVIDLKAKWNKAEKEHAKAIRALMDYRGRMHLDQEETADAV